MKFNSILYGNGLTIGLLNGIYSTSTSKFKEYISCNHFIEIFLKSPKHKRIYKNFEKYFKLDNDTENNHSNARKYLLDNLKVINEIGFERWGSFNLFNKDFNSSIREYGYILYNYWFHVANEELLKIKSSAEYKLNIANQIKNLLIDKNKIYTLNFDNLLDSELVVNHLHGRFILPLNKINELILFSLNNENNFEYSYLFGSSGLEKISRINDINKQNQNRYDLDFFYNAELNLGKLLLFGLSFGQTGILSEEFIKQYGEQPNADKLIDCIDGHILIKLEQFYNTSRINEIVIAYYSDQDLKYYKKLLNKYEFHKIVNFIPSNEFIDFKT